MVTYKVADRQRLPRFINYNQKLVYCIKYNQVERTKVDQWPIQLDKADEIDARRIEY